MYRWGAWAKGTFTMCGVRITQRMDFSFALDQSKYVHDIFRLMDIPKGPDKPVTGGEVSQLRALQGAKLGKLDLILREP